MICAQECRMLPDYRWWDFTCTARTPPAGGVESDSQATYDDETSPASAFHSTETDDLGTLTCRWARSRRAARRSLRPDGRAPAHRDVHHLSLIHISEPTRLGMISYAVFCLKKKKTK